MVVATMRSDTMEYGYLSHLPSVYALVPDDQVAYLICDYDINVMVEYIYIYLLLYDSLLINAVLRSLVPL